MYSNDKKGFSVLDLLVKIIFFILFIFILIWLFNKKMPNMTGVNSGIYRENIKYMQDAGEAYFTDDKMPTVEGESVRLTLDEMEKLNLVVPFVDKDGKACDKEASYVSVTKLEDLKGYELKTNLVCGKESNYVVKTLGCHNYCPNNGNCEKKCTISKVTEYQFRKLVEGTTTKYSCSKGYTLKGKYCVKSILKDSKSALVTKTDSKTYVKDATVVKTDAKLSQVKTTVTYSDKKVDPVTSTTETEVSRVVSSGEKSVSVVKDTSEVSVSVVKNTTAATTREETYSCQKTKTEQQCTTTSKKVAYSCDCATRYVDGMPKYTCNTCYKTVQEETCNNVTVPYTTTCTRTVTVPGTTTYSCPSGTTRQTGSGSSLKCYKEKTTYSCPSGTDRQTGSGSSLKCYKDTTTYTCPSGTTRQTGSGSSLKCYKSTTKYTCPSGTDSQTGSGSSLKCYKEKATYSCPSGTDVKEGSGSSLKCYKLVSGSVSYKCASGYKLNGTKCTKTENVKVTVKECKDKGYKLVGDKCNLYETKSVKASGKTVKTSSYKYIWSDKTEVAGYEKTGKTRTVDGEEICN